MRPKVSLALPVYNGANYVAETLQSILSQDFRDFELIVTDNASEDRTAEICRRFAEQDARIRYVRNTHNLGAAENYNRGFFLASGVYFKWCAHDDLLSPNFLGACLEALDRDPAAVLAYGSAQRIDPRARTAGSPRRPIAPVDGLPPEGRFLKVMGGAESLIFGLFRRSALAQTSLHHKYYGSDRALIAEAALLGPFVYVPGAVLQSRDHPDRSNRISDKRHRAQWQATDGSNRFALEYLHLVAHLFTIAWTQRGERGRLRPLCAVTMWAAGPHQISRGLLELIGIVSPQASAWLHRGAWTVLRRVRAAAASVTMFWSQSL